MRSRPTAALVLVTLLLAGCSSGGSGSSGGDGDGAADAPDAPAASVEPGATLLGVVGEPDAPDAYTITLTDSSGAPVSELPAGDYTIEVEDLSAIHNWHLTGDGVDEATGVSAVEQATFEVTLEPGTYTFICDPHPGMVGEITVV